MCESSKKQDICIRKQMPWRGQIGVENKHTKKKQEIDGKLKVIKEQVILIQWTSRKLKVI